MRDFYKEIEKAISRYEKHLYPTRTISWITNRIDWCFKFKHITESQMNSLADRIINIMKEIYR